MYKNGDGVERDFSIASSWYKKIVFSGKYTLYKGNGASNWKDLIKENISYTISSGNSGNRYDADNLEIWIETNNKQSNTSNKSLKIKIKNYKGTITKEILLSRDKCIFIKANGLNGTKGKDGKNKTNSTDATNGTDGGKGGNGGNVVVNLSKDNITHPHWLIFDVSPGKGAKGGKGGIISKGKSQRVAAKENTYRTETYLDTEFDGYSPNGTPLYRHTWRTELVANSDYQPAKTPNSWI